MNFEPFIQKKKKKEAWSDSSSDGEQSLKHQ